MLSSLVVATVLAIGYLVYDFALSRGAALPGGDLRVLAMAVLRADRPGRRERPDLARRPPADRLRAARAGGAAGAPRSGFFAAVPIAYLVMVVALQIVRPWFG